MACVVLSLVVAAAAAAQLVGDKPPLDGQQAFQGAWTIVSMTAGGSKPGKGDNVDQPVTAGTVVFEKDRYTIKSGDEAVEEGIFTADATKTPNRISVTVTKGADKGKKWHGVYELEGDTLRAVVGPADSEPPSKLTQPDPGTRAFTVRRKR